MFSRLPGYRHTRYGLTVKTKADMQLFDRIMSDLTESAEAAILMSGAKAEAANAAILMSEAKAEAANAAIVMSGANEEAANAAIRCSRQRRRLKKCDKISDKI